ncbi:hypothetical protein [Paenibacillus macerans]|uniref:hypothetical protein n=1 Tax=Paenibacillus macerans TaxID=44252 RepID=UPI003D3156D1
MPFYIVYINGSTASVRSPLSAAQSAVLADGSLPDARRLVIDQVIGDKLRYKQEPLVYRFESEYMGYTALFPEGEALRGYLIRGNTVSRFEFKDDFPEVVWQAQVKESDSLNLFLQGKWTGAKGDNPKIGKAYYAYSAGGWGDSWNEESGRIGLNGQFTATGYKRMVGGGVTEESGQIVYANPGEQRQETVQFAKPAGGPKLP